MHRLPPRRIVDMGHRWGSLVIIRPVHLFSENRKGVPGVPAIAEEHQTHGRKRPCADRPIGDLARYHKAGGQVEPHVTRMGELLRSRHRLKSVPGARQLHRCAVAPVVALQAQGQATEGRGLSTLAPLRALRARTPEQAWARWKSSRPKSWLWLRSSQT